MAFYGVFRDISDNERGRTNQDSYPWGGNLCIILSEILSRLIHPYYNIWCIRAPFYYYSAWNSFLGGFRGCIGWYVGQDQPRCLPLRLQTLYHILENIKHLPTIIFDEFKHLQQLLDLESFFTAFPRIFLKIYGAGTTNMATLKITIFVSYFELYWAELGLPTNIFVVLQLPFTITRHRIAFYGDLEDISYNMWGRTNQDGYPWGCNLSIIF